MDELNELAEQREEQLTEKRNKAEEKRAKRKAQRKENMKQIRKRLWDKIPTKYKLIIIAIGIGVCVLLIILAAITMLILEDEEKVAKAYEEQLQQETTTDNLNTYMSQFGYENSEEFTAMYDTVKSETEACGLNQQQIFALTAIACNCNAGLPTLKKGTFTDVYEAGLAAGYEKNSWQHNKYIWDKWWFETPAEMADANRTKIADATFETYAKGDFNFSTSEGGAIENRTKYIYYTEEQNKNFEDQPSIPITRTSSNEEEIFNMVENAGVGGTNGASAGEGTVVVDGQTYTIPTYTSGTSGRTFLLYKQGHPAWADLPAGSGTISNNGCRITAMATIMTGFGINIHPGQLSNNGPYSLNLDVFNKKGLNYAKITNKSEIGTYIRKGNPVIINVHGQEYGGSSPFTKRQHKMALLDINADGTEVYVSNPTGKYYKPDYNGWLPLDKVTISLDYAYYVYK